jgi:hypothetical protein
MSRSLAAALLSMALWPDTALAQLAELHLGAVVSYGAPRSYRTGAGLILGIAPGRLVYTGVRWVYYTGATERRAENGATFDVRTRSDVFAADLGLEFPAGPTEIVTGLTIGATRFHQRADRIAGQGGTASSEQAGTELLIAPNLSAQIRIGGLLLIPEVMYCLAGSPDVRWPVAHRGPLFGIRAIVPFEIARIRR